MMSKRCLRLMGSKLLQSTHALRGNAALVVVLPVLSDRAGGGLTRVGWLVPTQVVLCVLG